MFYAFLVHILDNASILPLTWTRALHVRGRRCRRPCTCSIKVLLSFVLEEACGGAFLFNVGGDSVAGNISNQAGAAAQPRHFDQSSRGDERLQLRCVGDFLFQCCVLINGCQSLASPPQMLGNGIGGLLFYVDHQRSSTLARGRFLSH